MRVAVDTHRARLLRLLDRQGLRGPEAEDIAQEAFWVLARRLPDVPPPAERAFLIATARHLASDCRRTSWNARVTEALPADEGESDDPGPDVCADARIGRSLIDEALAALVEEARDVFVLADLEEMSRSEIARMLSIPAGTVASRLAAARSRFQAAVRRAAGGRLPAAALSRRTVAASAVTREGWACHRDGARRFENNHWGVGKVVGRFEQRLLQRRRRGRDQMGWSWRWPGLDRIGFAYPEVLVGWKPWAGGEPTDGRFPMGMNQAHGLSIGYEVETQATGSYNLAAMAWLIDGGQWSRAAGSETISTEVMFWLDHSPGARPPGRLVDVATVGADTYELWLARGVGAEFRPGRGGWTTLSLRGPSGRTRGLLPVGALLGHLRRAGLVRGGESVASVEMGNAIMGGAGTTWVHRFDVRVDG